MAGLLRDRFFEYAPNRAWDLVTGESMSASSDADETGVSAPAPGPLVELLDHGIDGSPRWMVMAASATEWRAHSRTVAVEARRRGYVPIALDIFLRTRLLLAEDLRTRTLVLIAKPDAPGGELQAALLHAAAISPGPHVLMTSVNSRGGRVSPHWHVAEARAAYGATRLRAVSPAALSVEAAGLVERARRADDFVQAGRHAAAERLLRGVAAALARRRAAAAAAQTYIALGQVLLERGSVAAADAAFGEAAVQAEGAEAQLVVAARIWQAAARTDAGQLTSAEALCRAVLVTARPDDEERPRAEATLARVLLWQGRGAEATALPFVRHGLPSSSPFVEATAIRVLIEGNDLFEAGRRARDLLERSADGDRLTRVVVLGAHLRVLLAAGDLSLAEGAALRRCRGRARGSDAASPRPHAAPLVPGAAPGGEDQRRGSRTADAVADAFRDAPAASVGHRPQCKDSSVIDNGWPDASIGGFWRRRRSGCPGAA